MFELLIIKLLTIIGIVISLRIWWTGYKELDEQLRLNDEALAKEKCCTEQQ